MESLDCLSFIKEDNIRKRFLNIEAIAYKRTKAVENRIKVAKAAIANNDIKTFCEVMNVDTRLVMNEIESIPNEEREVFIKDMRKDFEKREELKEKHFRKEI